MFERAPLILCILLAGQASPVWAQQATPPRAVLALDPAAIRRDAAKLADIRGLLADPDPNVRLLAMREIMKSGDAVERQLALQAGLASADTSMVEMALRSVVSKAQEIVITLTDLDGKPLVKTDYAAGLVLTVASFDEATGQFNGPNLTGQLQGSVLSFRRNIGVSQTGILAWDPDTQEFKGRVNLYDNRFEAMRLGSWRPR